MSGMKLAMIALFGTMMLAGCSSLPSMGSGTARGDFAAGSALDYRLPNDARSALAQAATDALETGEARSWRTRRASGVVEPASYALANLQANPRARIKAGRGDFDLGHQIETEMGLYVATRNANVRLGPGTEHQVTEMITPGQGVEVVGRVTNKSWMLVAIDDVVRGYIFQNLLIKAPGTELELAGGPRRRPLLCREYVQRIDLGAERDEWQGAACNDGTGWRAAPPEVDPETQPENLLEF